MYCLLPCLFLFAYFYPLGIFYLSLPALISSLALFTAYFSFIFFPQYVNHSLFYLFGNLDYLGYSYYIFTNYGFYLAICINLAYFLKSSIGPSVNIERWKTVEDFNLACYNIFIGYKILKSIFEIVYCYSCNILYYLGIFSAKVYYDFGFEYLYFRTFNIKAKTFKEWKEAISNLDLDVLNSNIRLQSSYPINNPIVDDSRILSRNNIDKFKVLFKKLFNKVYSSNSFYKVKEEILHGFLAELLDEPSADFGKKFYPEKLGVNNVHYIELLNNVRSTISFYEKKILDQIILFLSLSEKISDQHKSHKLIDDFLKLLAFDKAEEKNDKKTMIEKKARYKAFNSLFLDTGKLYFSDDGKFSELMNKLFGDGFVYKDIDSNEVGVDFFKKMDTIRGRFCYLSLNYLSSVFAYDYDNYATKNIGIDLNVFSCNEKQKDTIMYFFKVFPLLKRIFNDINVDKSLCQNLINSLNLKGDSDANILLVIEFLADNLSSNVFFTEFVASKTSIAGAVSNLFINIAKIEARKSNACPAGILNGLSFFIEEKNEDSLMSYFVPGINDFCKDFKKAVSFIDGESGIHSDNLAKAHLVLLGSLDLSLLVDEVTMVHTSVLDVNKVFIFNEKFSLTVIKNKFESIDFTKHTGQKILEYFISNIQDYRDNECLYYLNDTSIESQNMVFVFHLLYFIKAGLIVPNERLKAELKRCSIDVSVDKSRNMLFDYYKRLFSVVQEEVIDFLLIPYDVTVFICDGVYSYFNPKIEKDFIIKILSEDVANISVPVRSVSSTQHNDTNSKPDYLL